MIVRCLLITATVACLACDAVDRCLDAGGAWDGATSSCIFCDPDAAPAACLAQDLAAVYQRDSVHFWTLFNRAGDRAAACPRNSDTASFLSLASAIGGNAEVSEAFAERVEKLVLADTSCFLRAAESLPESNLDALVRFYLNAPLFANPEQFSEALSSSIDPSLHPRVHARLSQRERAG